MNDKQTAYNYIDENADAFIGVSDRIWDFAELSLKEFQSAVLQRAVNLTRTTQL